MVNDLLIAMHPGVAGHRYDDPHKNMPHDFIQERLKAMGGPLEKGTSRNSRFSAEPRPCRAVSPSSSSFWQRKGLWTSASREGVERLATAGYAIARQAGLEDMYRPVLTEALAKLGDRTLPLNFVKGAPGKLLAMHLLV